MATLAANILTVGTTVRALEACELVPMGTAVAQIPAIIPNLPANADYRVRQTSAHLRLGTAQVLIGLFRETSAGVEQLLKRVSSRRTLDADDTQALAALAAVERPQHLFLNPNAYPSIWDSCTGRMRAEGLVILLSAATDPFLPLPETMWRAMADATERFLGHLKSPTTSPTAWAWVRLVGAFGCARISPSTAQQLHDRAAEIYLGHALEARKAGYTSLAIELFQDASYEFERAGDLPWYRLTQNFLGALYLERSQPKLTLAGFPAILDDAAAAIEAFEQGRYVSGRDKARARHAALLLEQPIRPTDPLTAIDARFDLAVDTYKALGRFRDEATTRRAWLRTKPTLVSPSDATNTLVALDRIRTILDDPTIVADYHTERGDWESAEVNLTGIPEPLARHHAARAQNDRTLTPEACAAHWRAAIAGIAATDAERAREWQEELVRLLFETPPLHTELLTALEELVMMDAGLREEPSAEETAFWRWLAVEGRIYQTVRVLLTHHAGGLLLDMFSDLTDIESNSDHHAAVAKALQITLDALNRMVEEAREGTDLPALHRELAAHHLHMAGERALPGKDLPPIPDPVSAAAAARRSPDDAWRAWELAAVFAAVATGDFEGARGCMYNDDFEGDSLFGIAKALFDKGQLALTTRALRAHLVDQPATPAPEAQDRAGA